MNIKKLTLFLTLLQTIENKNHLNTMEDAAFRFRCPHLVTLSSEALEFVLPLRNSWKVENIPTIVVPCQPPHGLTLPQ